MNNLSRFLLSLAFLFLIDKAYSQFHFNAYALHQVHLIDVKQGKVIENQTIVINEGLIAGVYDSKEYYAPDSIQLLDFKDHFVTPGLIDAHVHLGTDPSGEDNFEDTKKRLNHLLLNGVTSVRDMAGDTRYLSYVSRQAMLDVISAPDIYYSALFAGASFFKDPRTQAAAQGIPAGHAPWMRAIHENSDLDLIVAEAKGTGATGIKIYADLDEKSVQKIVVAAHSQGMKVWAHATVFPAKPSQVCLAGVDVMSHATYLAWESEKEIPTDASFRFRKHKQFNSSDQAFLDLAAQMQKSQTILDATIAVYQKGFPDSTLYRYGVSLTKLAYENNVPIGVGTDIPINLNESAPIFREMTALQNDVGMKPIDVIRAATIINAKMIGEENSIGSIEVGKKANMLILSNDPIDDISNLQKLELVIKNGNMFNSK